MSAQGAARPEALRFQVNTFTTKNSPLPHDRVTAVSIAADGTLWIGTKQGLSRLAQGQVTAGLKGKATLPDGAIRSILVTKDEGALWIATDRGLARIRDGQVAQVLTQAQGLPSEAITALAAADDRELWVGTDHGLARMTQGGVEQVLTTAQGLPSSAVRALAMAPDGLWVGTDRGLARVSQGQVAQVLSEEHGLPEGGVHSLATTEDGGLWVGTDRGIARVAQGRVAQLLTSSEGLPSNTAAALATGAHGMLWVATPAGFARVEQGQVSQVLTTAQGLPTNASLALAVEPDGTAWLGTEQGLSRIAQGQVLSVLTQQHGLPSNSIETLAATRNGTIWVGTQAGLCAVARGRVAQLLTTEHGLPANAVQALAVDDDDVVWVGTQGGLAAVAAGRVTERLTTTHGLPSNVVRALLAGEDGVVWVGTEAGLARTVRGRVTQLLTTRNGLPSNAVQALASGIDGVVWVSTSAGVASVVRGQVTQVLSKELRAPLSAWSMLRAEDGVFFMGTGYGLARVARGEVVPALTQGRWLLGAVGALLPAEQGGVWAGTLFGGLARVAQGQLSQVVTTSQGLPSNFVRALVTGSDGVFWAGTDAGLASLRSTGRLPQVLQLEGAQSSKLNAARQRFTVSAFDPEFQTGTGDWRYAWQLTRPSGESKRVEGRSPNYDASFEDDGSYALTVQAISSSGLQSEPHLYRFEVDVPEPDDRPVWLFAVATAIAVLVSLYLSLLLVLLAQYPQASWARKALGSWVFTKLPLLHGALVHSRWVRRQVFQNLAQAMEGLEIPEPYIQQAAIPEASPASKPLIVDGSRGAFDRWFQASGHTLVLGRCGTGKSVLLRFLARATGRSFLRGERTPIPVLVDLRSHTLAGQRLEDLIVDAMQQAGIELPGTLLDRVLESGGFLLLIDSLDDLPEAGAGAALHPFLNRNRGNFVLLATQFDRLRRHDLTRYHMADVPETHAQRYLDTALGAEVFEQLPHETRCFALNPLDLSLLTQFLAMFPDSPPPMRRGDLYRELLRQDAALGDWAEQNEAEIHAVYTLAFRMLKARQVLPEHLLRQWLRDALQSHATPLATAPKHALDEMMGALTQSQLFQAEPHREANGKRQPVIWFAHEMLGRFLCARHVRGALSGPDPNQRVAMVELAEQEAFSEVFYFVIDEISSRLELQTVLQPLLEAGGDVRLRIVAYALASQESLIPEPIRQQYVFAKLRADLRDTPARPR